MGDLSSGTINSNWNQMTVRSGLLTQSAALLPTKTVIANIKVIKLSSEKTTEKGWKLK